MIRFSFSSTFIAALACNLILIILSLLYRKKNLLPYFDLGFLGFFLVLAASRIFFPFELLPITHNIFWPQIISRFISWFLHPQFVIGSHTYSLWNFSVLISSVISSILLIRYILEIFHFHQWIRTYGTEIAADAKEQTVLRQILSSQKKQMQVQLMTLPLISTPMVCRYHKRTILLPENLSLSEEELYYVLRHELSHLYHHDLELKALVHLIQIVYWWNPFCYLLKRQTDLLLEMRIDTSIAKTKAAKETYLSCLLTVAKEEKADFSSPFAISFCTSGSSSLVKRFELLTSNRNSSKAGKAAKVLLAAFLLILYFSSFYFIIEASSIPKELMNEDVTLQTADNIYIIKNDSGTYDVFLNNKFLETTDSLEYYRKDLQIYENYEEYYEKNE